MEYSSKTYGSTIDQLRKDRKMSRVDLVSGIMSERNYQRFTKGEVAISNEKLIKLIDKLKILHLDVMEYIKRSNSSISNILYDSEILFQNLRFKDALVRLYTIDTNSFNSSIDSQKFKYLVFECKYALNEISKTQLVDGLSKLIDYPKILNFSSINVTETNALITLNTHLLSKNDSSIIDYLSNIMINEKSRIYGWASYKEPFLYASIAKGYYSLKLYQKSLDIAQIGINVSSSSTFGYALLNLFSYKTLSLHHLNRIDESISVAKKVFYMLEVLDNNLKKDLYLNTINKTLNIDIKDIVHTKRED